MQFSQSERAQHKIWSERAEHRIQHPQVSCDSTVITGLFVIQRRLQRRLQPRFCEAQSDFETPDNLRTKDWHRTSRNYGFERGTTVSNRRIF